MLKNIIISLSALFAVIITGTAFAKMHQSGGGIICEQKYALCTSAPCIPDPNDPTKAVCKCVVEQGKSFGTTSCDQRKPQTDTHGTEFVISTYSLVQYPIKKTMKCPSGNPWTNCLDKKCTVDPQDPTKAICVCDVIRDQPFVTLGGDCDTSTCATAYWSGATLDQEENAMAKMVQALGMKHAPNNWCPE